MVFVVLTRAGFNAIESRVIAGRDALWVNVGVLSAPEVARFREAGWNLTTWTNSLEPNNLLSDIDMVRLHHPDEVIWVEAVA